MSTRVAIGREPVAREIRAAGPLAERLRAPLTARPPWLAAALQVQTARWSPGRPVAVVVADRAAVTTAAAFLRLRRRGLRTDVTLLGDGVGPVPGGRPPARLLATDDAAAAALAEGITGLLGGLRGTWSLRLAGLPLGDPTARHLAARLRGAALATARSRRLVDTFDDDDDVVRSRDPRQLERWLPALLERAPDRRARAFLRTASRVQAAAGRLELAVAHDAAGHLRAALLTLVEGEDRWPWWSTDELPTEMGAPVATLSVGARPLLPAPDATRWLRVSGRGGAS